MAAPPAAPSQQLLRRSSEQVLPGRFAVGAAGQSPMKSSYSPLAALPGPAGGSTTLRRENDELKQVIENMRDEMENIVHRVQHGNPLQ